jgi:DNA-binding Lrp family transcriptional regulator
VDEGDRRGVDRLTIQEAARRLGISEGAVRKRVTRKTLEHGKEDDGRVYVYLDAGGRQGVDDGQDEGVDPNSNALISRLEDEVAYLREENRRKDEIIMQQAMTMRQLSAPSPQNATEAAETVEEEPEEDHATAAREARDDLGVERVRREMAESTMHEGMAEERRRREDAERERDDLRQELHARSRQQGAHETAEEQQGRGEPHSATGGAQERTQSPWWRRIFGR